ncbi:hypothetical protein J2S43_001711 [Catenuloplanes nepalensis]|uniref:Uncharacterized protein n=1 Tax=Catenuloplanes nepalensis TaxID=587533 RepID=A0ABT9MP37_9ACTN|nr:hypothetical protein [Catenuloplanes nepalensis]MDP9793199.1 hypothetical protein [Catenuloplanes nepalensis]
MIVRSLTGAVTRLLVSPAWFVPVDDFWGRRSVPGLAVALDRWDGAGWRPSDARPAVTPGGVIAFPGLGRRRDPAGAEPELFRARFTAAGYRPLYPPDDEPFDATHLGREFLAHPYDDLRPPEVAAEPETVPFLVARAYPHSANTRLLRGLARRADGTGVANALVEAAGQTADGLRAWRERTLCDDDGTFRLPLRWPGRPAGGLAPAGAEIFTLTATERRGRTGQVDVELPGGLGRTHVIEISGP